MISNQLWFLVSSKILRSILYMKTFILALQLKSTEKILKNFPLKIEATGCELPAGYGDKASSQPFSQSGSTSYVKLLILSH